MEKVFKYDLEVVGRQLLVLPKGAKILAIQEQHGMPCLWARVEETAETEGRVLATFGTGHPMDLKEGAQYLATYQLHGGSFVGHVFEEPQ